MPGIVKMENGGLNGASTDHQQDSAVNGLNGTKNTDASRAAPDKGKTQTTANNGNDNVNGGEVGRPQANSSAERCSRMNDLPDEIIHITQGFVPLSLLLTRLAQTTHNSLQEKIAELAKMPVPVAAMNGNSTYAPNAPDDTSGENIRKKATLLHFAQDMHAKWVKALVIAEWSRKSSMVSKLIDLKFHVDQQRILYDAALDSAVNVKRDLTYARMPSPDLKTALQILSSGTAPWIPDLRYIEPPPLTPDEQLKWINDLDTLLSLRLNLEDYDNIPFHFRDYDISSGRVTFKVSGEFEVDLTIADEDFEKQFWFIDFRYAFSPAAASLPESLRAYLEVYVNEALGKDGLSGCYQFLHEFVLTSKINELKRQAMQLSRSSWTDTLMVEPLNRALAIQYWTSRSPATGLKSWVLVAVNSGRKQDGGLDPKSASHLVAKWYRDNKEIKDVDIELDVENLSAESLLKSVVGRHTEFILSSIHDGLLAAPRFKNRETGMALRISRSDPGASSLAMQVGHDNTVSLLIEPTTGAFAVKPHSKFSVQFEHQLNSGRNAAEDGVICLENVRCGILEDELNRRGSSMGWFLRKAPMSIEELRSITKVRRWTRMTWLQKEGWGPSWFVVALLGLDGDEWWLLETYGHPTRISELPADGVSRNSREANGYPRFQTKLPLRKGHPDFSDTFWTNLTLFATGMITQSVDMRELYRHKVKSKSTDSPSLSLPQQVKLPSIEAALSAVFPAMVFDNTDKETNTPSPIGGQEIDNIELLALMLPGTSLSARQPWANDSISIRFKGVQHLSKPKDTSGGDASGPELACICDAIIKVRKPAKFMALNGMVDRDVSYNSQRGEFCLRIRRRVSECILATLKSRIKGIDRFVNFLEAMDRAKGSVTSTSMSLRQITFCYGLPPKEQLDGQDGSAQQGWTVVMDLSKDDIDIKFEEGNPHLRVIDLTRRLVNSKGGIGALIAWLPVSLPALQAITTMEAQWGDSALERRVQLKFAMETVARMNLHYTISSTGQQTNKHVFIDVKIRARHGEAWWHAWRSDTDAGEDEFSKALRHVWDGKGDNWLGLTTSAAGKPNDGVVRMLLAIDEAIRGTALASGGPFSQQHQGSGDAPVVILD